jgi:transposase
MVTEARSRRIASRIAALTRPGSSRVRAALGGRWRTASAGEDVGAHDARVHPAEPLASAGSVSGHDGVTKKLIGADHSLIEFICELRPHFRGQQVVLLWDGLGSHRSRVMQAFLATQRSWLTAERMPAYAPELNPVEGVWSNLKGGPLANRDYDTIEATVEVAGEGVRKVRRDQRLLFGFLAQTGLSL